MSNTLNQCHDEQHVAAVDRARCAGIDEAAEIRDKAAALQAYARQRDDADLQVWTAEIKLRAVVRIGDLVSELETAERARTDLHDATVVQTKTKAIEDAGLNVRTAQRYQELAGPREEQAHRAGQAGAEAYFARSGSRRWEADKILRHRRSRPGLSR